MRHFFVSHAGEDKAVASRLAEHLRNTGLDVIVDTHELGLGDDSIEFMNESIAGAGVVIILYSKHTEAARWQKFEINAAVWNEVEQDGGVCVVVRLDDAPLPPGLGPKVYGQLDASPDSWRTLIDALGRVFLQQKPASSVVCEAFGTKVANPFRRVRAEFFEDRPDLLAQAFAPPDASKAGALEDMKPCFLEGPRGTGKSMLLLSLRGRNYITRNTSAGGMALFGFYLKLTRGAICNAGLLAEAAPDPQTLPAQEARALVDISAQEIVVDLIESLFSEVSFCVNRSLLQCDRDSETELVESAHEALFGAANVRPKTFAALSGALAEAHRQIANFIRKRFIYGEICSVPVIAFDLESFKRIVILIRSHIPSLTQAMFVALLDEYENLFRYQQCVVNGLVKLGPPLLTLKVAKKLGTDDTSATTTGQELQEIHDYNRLTLVYDVEDSTQFRAYTALLAVVVEKLLQAERIPYSNMAAFLPGSVEPEASPKRLEEEVAKLCKQTASQFSKLDEKVRREKLTYYGEAAKYRILLGGRGVHRDKVYAGFETLAFASSGVVRYFQEVLAVAYYITYGENRPGVGSATLPFDHQSRAVHLVSQYNLTTLSRNVDRDGEALKYFLLDLGDCLRHKLLHHSSEPEAARLTLVDPERLGQPEMRTLQRLLAVGVREGVFQTKEGRPGFRPKHSSDPQPTEFNICRVYAPVLQISPRLRWRTEVTCFDLLGLADPSTRGEAVKRLKLRLVRPQEVQGGLFVPEEEPQT